MFFSLILQLYASWYKLEQKNMNMQLAIFPFPIYTNYIRLLQKNSF